MFCGWCRCRTGASLVVQVRARVPAGLVVQVPVSVMGLSPLVAGRGAGGGGLGYGLYRRPAGLGANP